MRQLIKDWLNTGNKFALAQVSKMGESRKWALCQELLALTVFVLLICPKESYTIVVPAMLGVLGVGIGHFFNANIKESNKTSFQPISPTDPQTIA